MCLTPSRSATFPASPASAIVGQLGVPIATVLSIVFLGEQVHWRRGLGIALTLAGALVVMWDPKGFAPSVGLIFVAAGTILLIPAIPNPRVYLVPAEIFTFLVALGIEFLIGNDLRRLAGGRTRSSP